MKKSILSIIMLAAAICSCQKEGTGIVDPFVKVLTESINLDNAAATNQVVMVQATEGSVWQAVVPEEALGWISLVKGAGNGSGRLVFDVTENEDVNVRTAAVTIKGSSPSGAALDGGSLTISQLGTDPSILATPNGIANVPSDADNAFIMTVTSNVEWKAEATIISGDEGWAYVASPTGPKKGSGEAVFAFMENKTEEARVAKLRVYAVEYSDLSVELTVTQQRAPAKYAIRIGGMKDYLSAGSGSMVIDNGSSQREYDCIISAVEDTTVISFDKKLAEGNYTLVSVTPSAGAEEAMGAAFSVDANGMTTLLSSWSAGFESFADGSEVSPIKISKAKHLKTLADTVKAGWSTAGLFFQQTEDISLAEYTPWEGIGTATRRFEGNYDGGGKSFTDLTLTAGAPAGGVGVALFNHIGGICADTLATIKNLTVAGSATCTEGYVAGLVSLCDSCVAISGCVGKVNIEGSIGAANTDIAGLVGAAVGGDITISDCTNEGTITITSGGLAQTGSNGGIVGRAAGSSPEKRVYVSNCSNKASFIYIGSTGGIVGRAAGYTTISRCSNTGDFTKVGLTVTHLGGIAGILCGTDVVVEECYNKGLIDGFRHCGGVVGLVEGTSAPQAVIKNCYNKGEVKAQGNTGNNGGVVGNAGAADVVIENSYNCGIYTQLDKNGNPSTTDKNGFGGVMGSPQGIKTGVSLCYYETGKGIVGGSSTGNNKLAADTALKAEGKEASFFTSGEAITGWDVAIWKFEAGAYPSLINNPE